MCNHENVHFDINVDKVHSDKVENKFLYSCLNMKMTCKDCGQPFEFVGLPVGISPYRPTVSLDGLELRQPVVPFGKTIPKDLPGMIARVVAPEEGGLN